jgi:hypothetical protein
VRFLETFRFELHYCLRNRSTWVYAAILFGVPFLIAYSDAGGWGPFDLNQPSGLAIRQTIFGAVLGMLVAAGIFGDAAVRDVESGMHPLLFTSRLRKTEYLGGRFLAALTVNSTLLTGVPLGIAAGMFVAKVAQDTPGPQTAAAYLQPFLLFVLPNIVLIGAVLFTIAVLARHVIPAYLGGFCLFVVYLIVLNNDIRLDSPELSALADPLGLSALRAATAYWTAAEREARLIGFPAQLLLNRLVWLSLAGAVLMILHRQFRFAHETTDLRTLGARRTVDQSPQPEEMVVVPRLAGKFGLRTRMRQVLAIARCSFEDIAGSRVFRASLVATIGLVLLWGWNAGDTAFDTSIWPVTHLVAGTVISQRMLPLIFLFIALYAGELVWKDRAVRVNEIADAAPVPDIVAVLGRFLSLAGILVVFQAVLIMSGILMQALQGFYDFEPGLYVRTGTLNLVNYLLLAALGMTVHVIVNQKYLANIAVVGAFGFTMVAGQFGFRHHLLVYGTDPGWTYSDMTGFGPFLVPLMWLKLYWAAWALLLLVIATLFWVRDCEPGLRRRLLQLRTRFKGPVARTAGAALALILATGGLIFYNTNVLNAYSSSDEAGRPQAEYERRYGQFENKPQPDIADANLRVEIYPDAPAVDVRGTYRLENRTGESIDEVHVLFMNPTVEARTIQFDRASTPVVVDDEVRYRIYKLERALEPGDSLQLTFEVSFRPRGFPNDGIQTDVVSNGTYINRSLLPAIGYLPLLELTDTEARKRFGLSPRPPLPGPDEGAAKRYRFPLRDGGIVHLETIVGTAVDQIAVTPGVLRRTWTESGRRYFHYETEQPIPFGPTIFSGRYAELKDQWKDIELRIFHHPTHTFVLDSLVRSMKASLDYYTQQFGVYPASQLSIVEIPRYGTFFGRGHIHMVAVTEDSFLSRVREGEFDQAFYGAAHETAHQWWGGQVMGAGVRGHLFLNESLANYSAMMVTRKTYGDEMARRVYDRQMEIYLDTRALFGNEVPLLEVEDQSYIAYRKGAIAMYALQEQIGEERVNSALRRYFERFRNAGPPYPTSLDLYAELLAVTPEPFRYLLTDLFETVTLWDVKTERVRVEPTGTGEYLVTLDVMAKKMRADREGRETEVPMDDFVEIAAFAPGRDEAPGEPLYLKQHRIRSGLQTIIIAVPREPGRAGIDPSRKLIDRNKEDNVIPITSPSSVPTVPR